MFFRNQNKNQSEIAENNDTKENINEIAENNEGVQNMQIRNNFSINSTVEDVINDEAFNGFGNLIFPVHRNINLNTTLEDVGDGMCDEVICDLELQMRICNGESVDDLVQKADELPRVRVIKLRNGGTGHFGGSAEYNYNYPPARLYMANFCPRYEYYGRTPYAFRRVLSH